jgi:hypothetical protein
VADQGLQQQPDHQQQQQHHQQQQQQQNTLPAYEDLQCELQQLWRSPLDQQLAKCRRIVAAFWERHSMDAETAETEEEAEVESVGRQCLFDTAEAQAFIAAAAEGAEQGFLALSQQVQPLGEALCVKVPVPWWCNNPACTVLAGASEMQLVGGTGCVCGGCKVAR